MWASPVVIVVKNVSANAGDIRDVGSVPELGRSPWRRAWQPTLVCLPGESRGQRRWRATVHGVAKSQTQLR